MLGSHGSELLWPRVGLGGIRHPAGNLFVLCHRRPVVARGGALGLASREVLVGEVAARRAPARGASIRVFRDSSFVVESGTHDRTAPRRLRDAHAPYTATRSATHTRRMTRRYNTRSHGHAAPDQECDTTDVPYWFPTGTEGGPRTGSNVHIGGKRAPLTVPGASPSSPCALA